VNFTFLVKITARANPRRCGRQSRRGAWATHDGQRGVVATEPDADNEVKLRFEDGLLFTRHRAPRCTATVWTARADSAPAADLGEESQWIPVNELVFEHDKQGQDGRPRKKRKRRGSGTT
jgi:hypothetical protein